MAQVSARDVKNRIRSMESTRQITKAMEMVASSRLRHAQARIAASRPYFEILRNTMDSLVASSRDHASPYLKAGSGSRTLFIVIAGDRGLAGGYNSSVLKLAMSLMEDRDSTVLPIGKKAVDFFRARKANLLTDIYSEAGEMDIGDCFSVAKLLSNSFLSGDFGEIRVVYTNFDSALSQTPADLRMLPLVRDERAPVRENRRIPIFEPDAGEVFAAIVPEYLGGVLYGALSESRCAEQAARRTAMDSATQNAGEMIAGLRQTYNRARQAAITQEITEIVAGANA